MRLSLLRWDYPERERERHDEPRQDGSAAGSGARPLRSRDGSSETAGAGRGRHAVVGVVGGGDEEGGEEFADGGRPEDDQ